MILFGCNYMGRFWQTSAVNESAAAVNIARQLEASGIPCNVSTIRLEKLGTTNSAPGERTIARAVRKERGKRKRKEPRPLDLFDNTAQFQVRRS